LHFITAISTNADIKTLHTAICGLMLQQFKDMSTENSTDDQARSNITKPVPQLDFTTRTAAFFDPAWQIAITIEFYFQYAALAIGIFGMAANALVLYALVDYSAREAKKRAINLLISHQNLLDLISCIMLVVTYSIGNRIEIEGPLGYFICTIFVSDAAMNIFMYASVTNLAILTIERYLKVVHPFWSKKHLKRWMIYAGMAFAWIFGILNVLPAVFATTIIKDGVCLFYFLWESEAVRMAVGALSNLFFFLLPLVIFIYCYGRIVVVMRRQMRVMAAHNTEGHAQMNASQMQSKRVKWNITKTMIIVSVAFVICWFPNNIYFVVAHNTAQTDFLYTGYYFTIFMAYLNTCMNPFIYAMKHEGVKERLSRLMMRLKCKDVTAAVDTSSNGNSGRVKQTPADAARQ